QTDTAPPALVRVHEPVTWGRGVRRDAPLSLTDAGRANELFAGTGPSAGAEDGQKILAQLPPVASVQNVAGLKTAAHVLVEVEAKNAPASVPRPAIASMEY